jgi:hypothetical protein
MLSDSVFDSKKISFISLILSHFNHLFILILYALIYNEIKISNQFHKANLIKIIFLQFLLIKISQKLSLID